MNREEFIIVRDPCTFKKIGRVKARRASLEKPQEGKTVGKVPLRVSEILSHLLTSKVCVILEKYWEDFSFPFSIQNNKCQLSVHLTRTLFVRGSV